MGRFLTVILFAGMTQLAMAEPFTDGICSFEGNPNLPKATCFLPTCAVGSKCEAPTVNRGNAKISYVEPVITYKDTCPDNTIQSGCWQVFMDFEFHLAAQGPNVVEYIGLKAAQGVDNKREFKPHWFKAVDKDPEGRFFVSGGMSFYVPPGQRLDLSIIELCARDKLNNVGCVAPQEGSLNLKQPRPAVR